MKAKASHVSTIANKKGGLHRLNIIPAGGTDEWRRATTW
jgi:hypothetical protein